MATPEPKNYAAALLDFAGLEIAQLIREHVPSAQRVLDVGAGWGKYRFLLPEYEMDAVEVWAPYVRANRLDAYYDGVNIIDVVDFRYPYRYGAVIMGDVLEHLSVDYAQRTLRAACYAADFVVVAVPFLMPQHEVDGNPYEAHLQEDLTESVMAERYPELTLNDVYGRKAIYHWAAA